MAGGKSGGGEHDPRGPAASDGGPPARDEHAMLLDEARMPPVRRAAAGSGADRLAAARIGYLRSATAGGAIAGAVALIIGASRSQGVSALAILGLLLYVAFVAGLAVGWFTLRLVERRAGSRVLARRGVQAVVALASLLAYLTAAVTEFGTGMVIAGRAAALIQALPAMLGLSALSAAVVLPLAARIPREDPRAQPSTFIEAARVGRGTIGDAVTDLGLAGGGVFWPVLAAVLWFFAALPIVVIGLALVLAVVPGGAAAASDPGTPLVPVYLLIWALVAFGGWLPTVRWGARRRRLARERRAAELRRRRDAH